MYSTTTLSHFHLPSLAPTHEITYRQSRQLLHQQQSARLKHPRPADEAARPSGLPTPPSDAMGTTYQAPNLASCGNRHPHHHSAFMSTLASNDRPKANLSDAVYEPASRYTLPSQQQQQQHHQQQQQHAQSFAQSRAPVAPSVVPQLSKSRQSTRSSTPQSGPMMSADPSTATRDATMVLHSLQIPACVSPRGGNLADFAAQVTCLFWFEPIKTLEAAENIRTLSPTSAVRRLSENAVPLPGFQKWVHTVLSTTQVTQNVILLALLFVYRLKVANPNVRGQSGSEYRLLTVALMLGNKFLDDNTYTNKTWAEVSGISVGEIHVMEVEFLSNMRYSLLVSKNQWEEWLVRLAKFWEYCSRAQQTPTSPLAIPSPAHRNPFVTSLPSPTSQAAPALHPAQQHVRTYSPVANSYNGNANQAWQTAYQAGNAVSPLALKPDLQNLRKRGLPEEDPTEPPAKRISRQPPQPQPQPQLALDLQHQALKQLPIQRPVQAPASDAPRLTVPSLTINTNNTAPLPSTITHLSANNSYAPQQASALSLPPLVPGVRAMATVYPPTTTALAPQVPYSSTNGPHLTTSAAPVVTPTTYSTPAYGTPTKRLSPQSQLTPATAAYASSPLGESFPHHVLTPLSNMGGTSSGVRTPISHSPSIYLQQRPSPYKPVRHVNTLLYPPPSAFLHEYHLSNAVPPTQMHYQPIGQRNEYRTGVVPEYALAGQTLYATGRAVPAMQQQMTQVQPLQRQFAPVVERPYLEPNC